MQSGAVEVNRLLANIEGGGKPMDLRRYNGGQSSCGAGLQVDAFLNFVYETMAEPLAEGIASEENPYIAEVGGALSVLPKQGQQDHGSN